MKAQQTRNNFDFYYVYLCYLTILHEVKLVIIIWYLSTTIFIKSYSNNNNNIFFKQNSYCSLSW